ncbi:MAG: hypothetical protein IPL88_08045 [Rhizobiales bacterium]|nr:hypothetical protein [Hyphomicrobiales bacterium]
MKSLIVAAAGFVSLAVLPAQALPMAPAPSGASHVEQTAMGCGRGWARNRWGMCRPVVRRFMPLHRTYRPQAGYDRATNCRIERRVGGMRRVCR